MCPPSTPISIEVTPEAAFSRTSSALRAIDRKSTRLNSSHLVISYAVFCLKKKKHYLRTRAGFLPKCSQGSLCKPSIACAEKRERLYKIIYSRVALPALGHPIRHAPSYCTC